MNEIIFLLCVLGMIIKQYACGCKAIKQSINPGSIQNMLAV
jgi:hypothetical protein